MSKSKKKKRYNLFQNLKFVFRHIHSWDKWALPVYIAKTPIDIVYQLGQTYFAPIIIALVESGKSVGVILAVTVAVSSILALSAKYNERFNAITMNKRQDISRRFDLMLGEKIMSMDYEILEGPFGKNKLQKAKNSLGNEGVYVFLDYLFKLITAIVGFTSFVVILSTLNPWIVVILFISFVLPLLADLVADKLVNGTKNKRAEIDRHLNYMTKSSRDFYIAKDIRLYNMRDCLQRMSEYFIGEKKFWTNKVYLYYFISDVVRTFMGIVVRGGAYAYLIYMCLTSDLSGSELVLYITSILTFGNWISNLGMSINSVHQLNVSMCDYREFLDIKNTMKSKNGLPIPSEQPYDIKIKDLSFTYPGSENAVLQNINLHIAPGEKLAIVGLNGAGKTTLVKLLCGLYRPSNGEVLLNNTNIAEFNRDEYYSIISAVFQDARFMPINIAENVSMKPIEKSDVDKIKTCLELAGLSDKVATLKNGIETMLVKNVNDDAEELSGGEMQKLLLARAIYKNAPVIILDEPTSALDPIAENEMYLRYSELTKGKTSVYISHRLSSTRFCDRIVLLDNNTITEMGTHDELMALGGKYAEMFAIQTKYYEKAGEKNEI